jgi:hypothetical protein
VITIGKSCHHAAPEPAAAAPKAHKPPPVQAVAPPPAPPVAHEAPAVSPAPPATSPARAAAKPQPVLRPRAAESKSLDPLAASTKVGELVAAAAPLPPDDGVQYELMLALLLAMLGAAAVWSYGGLHRYRYWRWR